MRAGGTNDNKADGKLEIKEVGEKKFKAKLTLENFGNEAKTYKFPYEYRNYRGEKEYVWPIPQPDVDSNHDLEQNDLWK